MIPAPESKLAWLDTPAVARRAHEFNEKLQALKQGMRPEFAWYPYDSLGTFFELAGLLEDKQESLFNVLGAGPVLDVGCADGDVSFFLESLGWEVTALDNAPSNYNGLRGARTMREALASGVQIREADLDSQFTLDGTYGAAFFCGILYHLKNPFYILETLARHARYCFLSTRIARTTPEGDVDLENRPMAYLLAPGEANADDTNYWIFSDAGLRRLLDRTGWEICAYRVAGDRRSDPVNGSRDGRALCLARSRALTRSFARNPGGVELLEGWHALESNAWRWTERCFAAAFPAARRRAALRLSFVLPEAHLARLGPVTIRAAVNGVALREETYAAPGGHQYVAQLPALAGERVVVRFELDKAQPPSGGDLRELGVVVSALEMA